MTKRYAQRRHARRRAAERYGIEVGAAIPWLCPFVASSPEAFTVEVA